MVGNRPDLRSLETLLIRLHRNALNAVDSDNRIRCVPTSIVQSEQLNLSKIFTEQTHRTNTSNKFIEQVPDGIFAEDVLP